jgi:hypothetical protein
MVFGPVDGAIVVRINLMLTEMLMLKQVLMKVLMKKLVLA